MENSGNVDKVGIGIIGCGNISAAYLQGAANFPVLDIRGVADLHAPAAQGRATEFGVPYQTVEALLADPSIEIIVNLTIPAVHVEVGLQVLHAGK
ncbi:MAG: Gfo/Idh/MocA family oxidoreductase, partial [Rhodoferax sp.]|uniref:Gfo/Idh/MocA family oxidoreductase n=1 Tax=Rhodoferax sp. TaxID=50421 RepID=UPI0032634CB0